MAEQKYKSSFSTVELDTIGCVWTGEFDLHTIRVDGEISESGKIKKYPDTSKRTLSIDMILANYTNKTKNE